MLDDCSASCKGNNKTLIDCWNLFQSALAAKSLGQEKQANLFIDYINKQLDCMYKGSEEEIYSGTVYFPITPDGKLKAVVSCTADSKFYVDTKTGELYQAYLEKHIDTFNINKDDELTVVTNNP